MDREKILQFTRVGLLAICILILYSCTSESSKDSSQPSSRAEAGNIQTSPLGNSVSLNATQSTGSNLTYHWTLRSVPIGSGARVSRNNSATPVFTADQPGSYVAQLIVVDSNGQSSKDFTIISTDTSAADVDHNGLSTDCVTCHNAVDARGKPNFHIASTDLCVVCHSVETWTPTINVDHNEVIGLCTDCHNGFFAPGQPADHIATTAQCNQCHIAGTTFSFARLTVSIASDEPHPPIGDAACVDCHDNVIEEGKPADHIPASDMCENCHVTTDWNEVEGAVSVEHPPIGNAACVDCHNNVIQEGKPADHIPASDTCENCHVTSDWDDIPGVPGGSSSEFEHPPIGDAACFDCHNNVIEEGKPADHIPASDTCENCHVTTDWEDVAGSGSSDDENEDDHPPIGNAACVDCHNNVIEEGKEDDHILTTDVCEACHTTMDWEPVVTVDHVEVVGECSSCHNNDIAQGKPPGHVETMAECNECHTTTEWSPLASGGGGAGGNVGFDHSTLDPATACMSCHDGTIATGKSPGHVITSSDCDVCHMTTAW